MRCKWAHEAGQGHPGSSGMETARPRGAPEKRIFSKVLENWHPQICNEFLSVNIVRNPAFPFHQKHMQLE